MRDINEHDAMPESPEDLTPPHRRGLTFDPTINAGHLLSLGGMCIALFMAMSAVDKRLTILEEAKLYQREKDAAQDAVQHKADEVIQRRLEKIDQKLDSVLNSVRENRRNP